MACGGCPVTLAELCWSVPTLTALIDDQIARYTRTTGYKDIHVTSASDIRELTDRSSLYISSEMTVGEGGAVFKTERPICVLVVEEVHCIPEWGEDFRKDLRKIGEPGAHIHTAQVMALTASASPTAVEDIKGVLGMKRETCVNKEAEKDPTKNRGCKSSEGGDGSDVSFTRRDIPGNLEGTTDIREDIRQHVPHNETLPLTMTPKKGRLKVKQSWLVKTVKEDLDSDVFGPTPTGTTHRKRRVLQYGSEVKYTPGKRTPMSKTPGTSAVINVNRDLDFALRGADRRRDIFHCPGRRGLAPTEDTSQETVRSI
ncbi:hypothetical protein Bbelb_283870 [Branchiostoma belcheri]|nr:hypothetical protein Bbelb_283870 [Branchiostoma belcheri]